MSIRHNNKTIAGGYSPTSYRYVGEIFQSALPITDPKVHALDGSKITITEGYAQFIQHLNNLVLTYPQLACTEEEWQSIKSSSKLGQCGKFVITDTTVRLPLVINTDGLTDLTNAGLIKDESLPNISGSFGCAIPDNHGATTSGSFVGVKLTKPSNVTARIGLEDTSGNLWGYSFGADLSSSAYKDNAPVQQEAIQYPYYIVLATGVVQNITYYEDLKVNNTNVFGDTKYIVGDLNNSSWLKSEGQWNSSTTYKSLYEWILTKVNKGEPNFKTNTGHCYINTVDSSYWVWINAITPVVNATVYGWVACEVIGKISAVTSNGFTYYDNKKNRNITVTRSSDNDSWSNWENDYSWYINTTDKTFRLPLISDRKLIQSKQATASDSYWFNLYSDGWLEQGGIDSIPQLSGSTSSNVDCYFNRYYKDTNYDVNVNVILDPGNSTGLRNHKLSRSTDKVSIGFYSTLALSGTGGKFLWSTQGFADTSLYNINLYYYVGNVVQNADLINAGALQDNLTTKLDKDLSNISTNSRETITRWGYPSNKYINLTLNASGSSYTAPADGYVVYHCIVSEQTGFYQAGVTTSYGARVQCGFYGYSNYGGCVLPISKGQWFQVYYETNTTSRVLQFVYCKGDEPTA